MVKVLIDGKQYSGKDIVVKEWNSQSHKMCIYAFSDDYDKADEILKKEL